MLALPAAASASTYTVNSTGDQEDEEVGENGCKTSVNTCTLRAAIEELNYSAEAGVIKFSASFNGQVADTIALASELPAIEETVHINGDGTSQCATEAGVSGPCVGISGPAAGSALFVEAPEVEVEGLAVTGAKFGINVSGAESFKASDNWLGVKLDGKAGGNTAAGLLLAPESSEATIGGTKSPARNVFAYNAGDGLDILGAEFAVVQGNYFGVKPDGSTQAANGKDVEVTDSAGGFEATGNEIGATITGSALTTAACDSGCNVISGATSSGVDLQGNGVGQNEKPATGQTTVNGNSIGLNAAGTAVVGNGTFDVFAGAAGEAMIGGPFAGDANYIAGGEYGVYNEEGEGFQARNNVIGFNAVGAEVTPPSQAGVFAYSLGVAEPPVVSQNRIRMASGIGVEQRFGGALIAENSIEGGLDGVLAAGSSGAENWIEGNLIEGASANGILVESDLNQILGNEVLGSGGAGVRIKHAGPPFISPTTENVVGGDTPATENLISASGGDAIEIIDLEETENGVARNRGSGNAGSFIDLVATEPGTEPNGPNEGIKPPVIASAKLSGASGSGAQAGAKVRVFRKTTASPGEIASFLGEATADGSGNWSVTYAAAIPGETQIAATQTDAARGTSELAFAKTEPPPNTGGGSGDGGSGGGEKGPGKDELRPKRRSSRGRRRKTHATTAKFKFSSSEAGSTFQCKLDGKPFKACRSPKTYKKLKPGKHVFKVRAIDAAGNVDPSPGEEEVQDPRLGRLPGGRRGALGRRLADPDRDRHDRDLGVDAGAAGEDRAVGDPDAVDAAQAAFGVDRMAGRVRAGGGAAGGVEGGEAQAADVEPLHRRLDLGLAAAPGARRRPARPPWRRRRASPAPSPRSRSTRRRFVVLGEAVGDQRRSASRRPGRRARRRSSRPASPCWRHASRRLSRWVP